MLKKNKWMLLFSLLVTLLPAVAVFVKGDALGKFYGMRTMMIVIPLAMAVLDVLCVALTLWTNRRNEQNKKILAITFWIMPAISVLVCGIFFLTMLGEAALISVIMPLFLGLLMIVMGNYMPKCKRNTSVGFKMPWTLANEENWNKTHRFGGYVMMVVGALIMLTALLPEMAMIVALLVLVGAMVTAIAVYSAALFQKQLAAGTAEPLKATKKAPLAVTLIISVVVLCGAAVLMFTGDVTASCGDTALSIKATYWADAELPYADIDSIEYRESVPGSRVGGFGSPRQLLGNFANDEFGSYTRYTYGGDTPCIVLKTDGGTIVLGLETVEETKALYEALTEKLPK